MSEAPATPRPDKMTNRRSDRNAAAATNNKGGPHECVLVTRSCGVPLRGLGSGFTATPTQALDHLSRAHGRQGTRRCIRRVTRWEQ
jgi:hypothetical protein